MLFREPGFSKEPEHPQLTPILIRALLKNWLPLPSNESLFRDFDRVSEKGIFFLEAQTQC